MLDLQPAILALCGVIIGGAFQFYANKHIKSHEWKIGIIKERLNHRERIFTEFLACSQRLVSIGEYDKVDSFKDFHPLSDCFAQIEMLNEEKILSAARNIFDFVVTSHSPKAVEEKRDFYKLKKDFVLAARAELVKIENDK